MKNQGIKKTLIDALRKRTGANSLDCAKALQLKESDIDLAEQYLKHNSPKFNEPKMKMEANSVKSPMQEALAILKEKALSGMDITSENRYVKLDDVVNILEIQTDFEKKMVLDSYTAGRIESIYDKIISPESTEAKAEIYYNNKFLTK